MAIDTNTLFTKKRESILHCVIDAFTVSIIFLSNDVSKTVICKSDDNI